MSWIGLSELREQNVMFTQIIILEVLKASNVLVAEKIQKPN